MARGPSSSNNSHSSRSNSSSKQSSSLKRVTETEVLSTDPSTSPSGENPTGLLARLQTPEALEYMRYFVLLNSLFILLTMGMPYFSTLWNSFK